MPKTKKQSHLQKTKKLKDRVRNARTENRPVLNDNENSQEESDSSLPVNALPSKKIVSKRGRKSRKDLKRLQAKRKDVEFRERGRIANTEAEREQKRNIRQNEERAEKEHEAEHERKRNIR